MPYGRFATRRPNISALIIVVGLIVARGRSRCAVGFLSAEAELPVEQ